MPRDRQACGLIQLLDQPDTLWFGKRRPCERYPARSDPSLQLGQRNSAERILRCAATSEVNRVTVESNTHGIVADGTRSSGPIIVQTRTLLWQSELGMALRTSRMPAPRKPALWRLSFGALISSFPIAEEIK